MIIQKKNLVDNPLVSILVCAYNREKMIEQTINSILQQICDFPFEIIIGEDCGTDRTRGICIDYQKKHPSIIKLILNETNQGLGANWGLLMQQAKGKYIASCDDDDYWHNPEKLQLQVDFLETHTDYGMVHTEIDLLNDKSKKLIRNFNRYKNLSVPEGNIMKEIFTGKAPICVSASMLRKELADKYIPYNDYISMRFNIQDWPTWIILSKYSKIGYIPVSTTTYRIGHYAISNLNSYEKAEMKLTADMNMYKYICNMFRADLEYIEKDYLTYGINILLNLAFLKNDYSSARKFSRQLQKLGSNNLKVKLTQNRVTFRIFAIMKRLRQEMYEK